MLTNFFKLIGVIGLVGAPIIDPDLNNMPRHSVYLNNVEFSFNYGGSSSFVDINGKLGTSYVNVYLTYDVNISKDFTSSYAGLIEFNSVSGHIDVSTYYDGSYYENDEVFNIYEWNTPYPRYIGLFQDSNYDVSDVLPILYQYYYDDPIQYVGGVTFNGNNYILNGGANGDYLDSYNILNRNGYPYKTNFKVTVYEFFYNLTESCELISEYAYTHGDNYLEGYNAGKTDGYNEGIVAGGGFSDALGAVTSGFSGLSSLFSLEILPNITLGLCISIPFILILIIVIFKIARG